MDFGCVMFLRPNSYYRLESVAEISIFFRSLSAGMETSIEVLYDRISAIATTNISRCIRQRGSDRNYCRFETRIDNIG